MIGKTTQVTINNNPDLIEKASFPSYVSRHQMVMHFFDREVPNDMCRMYNYSTSVQVSLVSFIFFAGILHCKDKYQNNVISVINVMILIFMRILR